MSRHQMNAHPEFVKGRGWSLARRGLILGAGAAAVAFGYARGANRVPNEQTVINPFRDLERHMGGRLGVYVIIPDYPHILASRPHERFPMCSSFKFVLAACVLAKADAGRERLDTPVRILPEAVLSYAPVTSLAAKEGRPLTVWELCEAAVKVSDNTAANLLLERVGGPAGLTHWMRKYDKVTRLDRNEPSLNSAIPGDPRDTTTPSAMVGWLDQLIGFDDILKPTSRTLLKGWMVACTTGLNKIRAGVPKDWTVADKTGNNGSDTMGDVAMLTPPGNYGQDIYVAAYVTGAKLRGAELDAVFAEVGRIATAPMRGLPIHG
jgi:beta-lactamase class A